MNGQKGSKSVLSSKRFEVRSLGGKGKRTTYRGRPHIKKKPNIGERFSFL